MYLYVNCGKMFSGYYWVATTARSGVPPTAVRGGVDQDGTQIYVGRANHEGDWIPAKVIPEKHIAYVAYGGKEHGKTEYQASICAYFCVSKKKESTIVNCFLNLVTSVYFRSI